MNLYSTCVCVCVHVCVFEKLASFFPQGIGVVAMDIYIYIEILNDTLKFCGYRAIFCYFGKLANVNIEK